MSDRSTTSVADLSHSFRFEHKLGPRLKVTALIDPSTARAEQVLEGKRQSFVESAYRDTKVYKTIEDYHVALNATKTKAPECVRPISRFLQAETVALSSLDALQRTEEARPRALILNLT